MTIDELNKKLVESNFMLTTLIDKMNSESMQSKYKIKCPAEIMQVFKSLKASNDFRLSVENQIRERLTENNIKAILN
ncbi:MAG: hypothetical protein IPM32_18255 [Ignavibacteriae bacterium]|nr:hypothetical protein [Ignavibacteriota bacterium]